MSERKVALITGGSRGIGRAIVANLIKDYDVAMTWNTTAPVDQDGAYPIQCNLVEDAGPEYAIAQTINRFGRLDVLINCAGLVKTTPYENHVKSDHAQIMNVNYHAPVALLSAALPYLKAGAAVINISSGNADLPPKGAVTYGASKAALNLWTKGMAKELGPKGIRVNAVAPGATEIPEDPRPDDLVQLFVDMTALGRIGRPEDIANAVRFLASDEAGFITGEILNVSGGYRL
ncbi:MAG: SDR family oxidoreductase [Pseudoruegeria sp.]